jgi:8-oxo-dGTP pyrophosphatase MutT (NUDIX family)
MTSPESDLLPVATVLWQPYKRPVVTCERFIGCRALLLDTELQNAVLIQRIRDDNPPYYVLPGGGMMQEDKSPQACIWRELREELGVGPEEVILDTENAITCGGMAIFSGILSRDIELVLGYPENERDITANGQYNPIWLPSGELGSYDLRPRELSDILIGGIRSAKELMAD